MDRVEHCTERSLPPAPHASSRSFEKERRTTAITYGNRPLKRIMPRTSRTDDATQPAGLPCCGLGLGAPASFSSFAMLVNPCPPAASSKMRRTMAASDSLIMRIELTHPTPQENGERTRTFSGARYQPGQATAQSCPSIFCDRQINASADETEWECQPESHWRVSKTCVLETAFRSRVLSHSRATAGPDPGPVSPQRVHQGRERPRPQWSHP
jgi:hypothetical protein